MINQISGKVHQFYFSKFGSCAYLIKDKKVLIDTSSEINSKELINDLNNLKIKPEQIKFILLTHSHYDHIGNTNLFPKAKILTGENKNQIEKLGIKVIKTPGHTKDSVCFLYQDILFSGDTLFFDGIGRIDFPESQPEKMQESLNKLKSLNYKILCPGHID